MTYPWNAGEVLSAADLNSEFASKPTFTYGTATPTADADGAIWYDENDTPPTPKFWDGSAWQPFSSGLAYAVVSSPAATGNYTDGNGIEWNYYTFTASSSITTSAGFVDVLIVGGGGGGDSSGTYNSHMGGGAGGVRFGSFEVTAGTHTITVGAGGGAQVDGNESGLASFLKVGGGQQGHNLAAGAASALGGGGSSGGMAGPISGNYNGGGAGGLVYGSNEYDGLANEYTGSTVTYGAGGLGASSAAGAANTGDGGGGDPRTSGGSGIVVVRVKA